MTMVSVRGNCLKLLIFSLFIGTTIFIFGKKLTPSLLKTAPELAAPSASGPENVPQDDPPLVAEILANYIEQPSALPYNLSNPRNENPSMGQATVIDEILQHKKDGFFVECGALDGETRSNTLYFERKLGWKGVLIEGDPKNYKLLRNKNRRAFLVKACLSTKPYPVKVNFLMNFNLGRISDSSSASTVSVQCFPLASILFALDRKVVDYFSLDVEGNELDVLRTIPWDKVDIRTLSVEFAHVAEGKSAMVEFMKLKGYTVAREVTHVNNLANDFIFVKNDTQQNVVKT